MALSSCTKKRNHLDQSSLYANPPIWKLAKILADDLKLFKYIPFDTCNATYLIDKCTSKEQRLYLDLN